MGRLLVLFILIGSFNTLAQQPDFYGEDGKRPPQFVLLSFDGGGDLRMWKDTLKTAEDFEQNHPGKLLEFTYFFSGSYVIPRGTEIQQNYLNFGMCSKTLPSKFAPNLKFIV